MASLINSVRSIASDSFWVVKIAFISSILFVVMDNDLNYPNGNPQLVPVYFVIAAIMMGCASVAMHRNLNNKVPLFPSLFDIFEIINKSIGSVISITPGLLVYYASISFVKTNFVFEPFVMTVIYLCITVFFAPFIFIPTVLYSVNGRLTDAFRLKNILDGSGNFIVQFLSYVIQYVFIIGILTYLVYTVLLEMLGDHVSLLILKCIVIVISFFSVFIYCSDLYEDVIPEIKNKPKIKSKRKVF